MARPCAAQHSNGPAQNCPDGAAQQRHCTATDARKSAAMARRGVGGMAKQRHGKALMGTVVARRGTPNRRIARQGHGTASQPYAKAEQGVNGTDRQRHRIAWISDPSQWQGHAPQGFARQWRSSALQGKGTADHGTPLHRHAQHSNGMAKHRKDMPRQQGRAWETPALFLCNIPN